MLYCKKYQIVIILSLCFFSLQGTFKINDVAINTLTVLGDWVSLKINSNVKLIMSGKDKLKIENITFGDQAGITQYFDTLINGESPLCQMSSGGFSQIHSGRSILLGRRFEQSKASFFRVPHIEIQNSFFQTSSLSLMGKRIELTNCFVDAFTLEIESDSSYPLSHIQVIRFIFDAHSQMPAFIDGQIDFSQNLINNLVVGNVKSIEILFRSHAF